MHKPITIVGGGIAGLTLGIGLRRRGVPVTVFEAGKYPRHRVCGEFISGRGQQVLERLDLKSLLCEGGAVPANTARFFSENVAAPVKTLPTPAICLSRFKMDALLANTFQKLGGELREAERYQAETVPGVVRATGRRVNANGHQERWFGLKAHARGVKLSADLEMHLSSRGYIGLCKIEGDVVNVCGLFRRRQNARTPEPDELLRGEPGTFLRERLDNAIFDENSFCAVAGLSFRRQRALTSPDCSIGDALSMIAPMTGNGMSMAFESAETAIEPLVDFSRGVIPWEMAQKKVANRCDKLFSARLSRAVLLQALLTRSTAFTGWFLRMFGRSEPVWRMAFRLTR